MEGLGPALLLRDDRSTGRITVHIPRLDAQDPLVGIRCPLCAWRPLVSSRWMCDCRGTPEPPFSSCGTRWNTFETAGCCPGCSHRWRWTSCLRCYQPSPHEDWYEDDDRDLRA